MSPTDSDGTWRPYPDSESGDSYSYKDSRTQVDSEKLYHACQCSMFKFNIQIGPTRGCYPARPVQCVIMCALTLLTQRRAVLYYCDNVS